MNKIFRFLSLSILLQLIVFILMKMMTNLQDIPSLLLSFNLVIILIGAAVLFVKAKKEQFVGRFMIATTFQMLSVLSVILAFAYKKIDRSFEIALWLLVFFLVHLIYQSIELALQSKREA